MALIGVLIVLAMLMSMAAVLAISVTSDTQQRGAFSQSVTGFYAAEAGLNVGMADYKNIFLDYRVPSGSDFAERSYNLGNRTVVYRMSERPDNPEEAVIPAGEVFSGLNVLQYRYIVNSHSVNVNGDVEASVGAEFLVGYIPLFQFVAFYTEDLEILPGPIMVLNGRVHTNGDLYLGADERFEIADKPAAGIYTVQVSARGDIYRGRKNEDYCNISAHVYIDKLEDVVAPFGDLDPKELPCNGSGTRPVPATELSQWQGSILSNIGNIAVPEPGIIEKGTGIFWEKADLRIVLKLNQAGQLFAGGPLLPHTIEVQDADGGQNAALTAQLHAFMMDWAWNQGTNPGFGPSSFPGTMPIFYTDLPTGCGCDDANPGCGGEGIATCYTPNYAADSRVYQDDMGGGGVFDGEYRRGGFYNWREHKWMQILNINATDLILWNQQKGEPFFDTDDTSHGGLVIFVSVEGPGSGAINNYGARVFGSANLPIPGGIGVVEEPTGLTVVSDQAIYVAGDFNRGLINPGDLPRQPASLIGDSVNVLSQGYWGKPQESGRWRDGKSLALQSNAARQASNTTVNAAFLGGVDATPGRFSGNYNGGLENYPRFHENWTGYAFNYQGSFVSLGEPEHVNGPWCGTGDGCNIYSPPQRNWNFDPAFNDAANLPPLTPRFVYVQQVLFTEDFN